jgi:hypothetical protein
MLLLQYVKRNALYVTRNDAGKLNKESIISSVSISTSLALNLFSNYVSIESAKLALGPLWAEIMDNINSVVDLNAKKGGSSKFALFSGHDTTIMPLLASLGPRVWDRNDWPPYASMVLIEVSVPFAMTSCCI